MADVIGGQQKSAGSICIFGPDYPNTRDTAKQQFYQQPCSAIRCHFDSHCLSVSLTRHRRAIFQADSFFERGIIVGGSYTRFWL
jgi:hypothetical protein